MPSMFSLKWGGYYVFMGFNIINSTYPYRYIQKEISLYYVQVYIQVSPNSAVLLKKLKG